MRGARQLPVSADIATPQRFGKLRASDAIGLHVPRGYLQKNLGSDPGAWRRARADLTVGNRTMRVPMFDSPGRHGRAFEPTDRLAHAMGTNDLSGARMQHQAEAGPDYMTDPQAFHEEQGRLGNELGMRQAMMGGATGEGAGPAPGQMFMPGEPSGGGGSQSLQIPYVAMQQGGVVPSLQDWLLQSLGTGYDPWYGTPDATTGLSLVPELTSSVLGTDPEDQWGSPPPNWPRAMRLGPMPISPLAPVEISSPSGGALGIPSFQEGGTVPEQGGRVDAATLKAYLKRKFADSGLVGYVPPDGARWGIKTGSAEEWASFGLAVAKQESDLNPRSVNLADPGGSYGLFQFGTGQTQFTGGRDQFNPQNSADAFVRSVEHYVSNGNVANLGATFGSIARPNEAGQYISYAQGVTPSSDTSLGTSTVQQPTTSTPEALAQAAVAETTAPVPSAATTPAAAAPTTTPAAVSVKPPTLPIGPIGSLPGVPSSGAGGQAAAQFMPKPAMPSLGAVPSFAQGGTASLTPALVGEAGSEKAILPSGKRITVGKTGPEVVALPPGTEVIPHFQEGGTVPQEQGPELAVAPKPPTTGAFSEASARGLFDQIQSGVGADNPARGLFDQIQGEGAPEMPWWGKLALNVLIPGTAKMVTTEEGRNQLKGLDAAIGDTVTGTVSLLRGGIGLALNGSLANFQGKSIPEVQAQEKELVVQRDRLQHEIDSYLSKGNTSFFVTSMLGGQVAALQARIEDADGIIKSGAPRPAPPLTGPLKWLDDKLRYVQELSIAQKPAAQQALPTTEAFDQSVAGQLATGEGQLGGQLPFMFAAPEVRIPAFAAQFAGQAYDEARAKGADDKTAQSAALMDAMISPLQAVSLEVPAASLAKLLEGSTPAQAIRRLGLAYVRGSASLGTMQLYQNWVARLSGYDPNRPLDEGVLQQVLLGGGLDAAVTGLAELPGMFKYSRPAQVEVRQRSGSPPEAVQSPQGAPRPPPPQAGAPVTPVDPLAAAAAQVRQTAGGTPEEIIAAQQAPEARVAQSQAAVDQMLRGFIQPQPGAPPVVPTAAAGAVQPAEPVRAPEGQPATPTRPLGARPTTAEQAVGQINTAAALSEIDPRTRDALVALARTDPGAAFDTLGEVRGRGALAALRGDTPEATQTALANLEARRGQISAEDYNAARAMYERRLAEVQAQQPSAQIPADLRAMLVARGGEGYARALEANYPYVGQRLDQIFRDNPEGRARFDRLAPDEKNRYLIQILHDITPADLRGEPTPPERPTPTGPLDLGTAKRITNDAGEASGLKQRINFVPDASQLPPRIRKALSQEELSGTAQTVYDKTLGELWVIGSRFDSADQLHRALIQDAIPRVYQGLTDLRVQTGGTDPRLGYYDILGDRPVLNANALMRTADPLGSASRTALEEVVVHQGFSRLFGSREADTYKNAMTSVRQRFDAMGLSDQLARAKGFVDLEDMARAYGFDDYASNPRHNHALTEELIGAYAQRFGTLDELVRNSPRWYQQALGAMSDAIRRRLGMQVRPYDVQNLIADSFAALRQPKYGTTPSPFHPEITSQAQQDWELAARTGTPPPPPPPVGEQAEAAMGKEPAQLGRIGDVFVAAQRATTRAGLERGEDIRDQPWKQSFETERPFSERMGLATRAAAVYDVRTLQAVMDQARQMFHSEWGADPYRAMDEMRAMGPEWRDIQPALRGIINESINAHIADYQVRGFDQAARAAEMKRDAFNRDMAPLVTSLAQALNAQKLLYENGDTAVGRMQAGLAPAHGRIVGSKPGVNQGYNQIKQLAQRTAGELINRSGALIDGVQAAIDRSRGSQQSLADRYISALAQSINARMGALGFTDADKPALQELFNRFQASIQQQVREGMVAIPDPAKVKLSATDTIKESLSNFPMFERAWQATVDRLKFDNPNQIFFSNLDSALAQPVGEAATRSLLREAGYDLHDLIYRHYSLQDRVPGDLANALTRGLNLPQDLADRFAQTLDGHYRNLLETTASKELQGVLDRIANPRSAPLKGELERLTDLMAIGGLDKQEYYNLLARRFGLGAWDAATVGKMRELGTELQRIRDEGGPTVYKNQIAAQLADQIARSQPELAQWQRRAEGLWMASLLTGPFTHGSYWGQNFAQVTTNLLLRSLFRPGIGAGDVTQTFSDLFHGLYSAATTELPTIVRTGAMTQRELPTGPMAMGRAEGIPWRSALEATPLPGEMRNPLNWYRYVGRVLHGMETVFYRGANLAVTRSLALRLADERGMNSEEAHRFAEQVVYGTENDRQEAIAQAGQEQQRFGFDDGIRQMRVQELLDQKRFARAPELADEAHRFALHSVYRESPYGFLGKIARGMSDLRRDNPQMSLVTPFINLPANVANEFMNWTPIGILRGRDALPFRGGTEAIRKLYADVPQVGKLIEAGQLRDSELRDLAYEYLAKGVIGTLGMAALGTLVVGNKDQPDPWFDISGAGPADSAHRDQLRAGGWQPYSVKIGPMHFDYQATPWKGELGLIGAMGDEMKYGKYDPQQWLGALAAASVKDSLSIITDASFLQGLQTLLAVGGGPGGGRDVGLKVNQFLSQELSSLAMIPFGGTGTKQLWRAVQPQIYGANYTDLGEMILRNIPLLNSAFLQPRLNALGDPVEINPIHRLQIAPTVESDDRIYRFLDAHNIGLTVPAGRVNVDNVQLSPQEHYDFVKTRGQSLRTALDGALNDAGFLGLSSAEMEAAVKEMERDATADAKDLIRQQRQAK